MMTPILKRRRADAADISRAQRDAAAGRRREPCDFKVDEAAKAMHAYRSTTLIYDIDSAHAAVR